MAWNEIPKSPGHVFYDGLQSLLNKSGFDHFAKELCAPLYATRKGRPSIPPGRYFRMHLVRYFEGIESERGIEWRCADALSIRESPTDPDARFARMKDGRTRLAYKPEHAVDLDTGVVFART